MDDATPEPPFERIDLAGPHRPAADPAGSRADDMPGSTRSGRMPEVAQWLTGRPTIVRGVRRAYATARADRLDAGDGAAATCSSATSTWPSRRRGRRSRCATGPRRTQAEIGWCSTRRTPDRASRARVPPSCCGSASTGLGLRRVDGGRVRRQRRVAPGHGEDRDDGSRAAPCATPCTATWAGWTGSSVAILADEWRAKQR